MFLNLYTTIITFIAKPRSKALKLLTVALTRILLQYIINTTLSCDDTKSVVYVAQKSEDPHV